MAEKFTVMINCSLYGCSIKAGLRKVADITITDDRKGVVFFWVLILITDEGNAVCNRHNRALSLGVEFLSSSRTRS